MIEDVCMKFNNVTFTLQLVIHFLGKLILPNIFFIHVRMNALLYSNPIQTVIE